MSFSINDLAITHIKMCDITAPEEAVTFDRKSTLVKFDMEKTWEKIKESNTSPEISVEILIE